MPTFLRFPLVLALLAAVAFSLSSCDDDEEVVPPDPVNEEEEITTVRLTLTPSGGFPIVVTWTDLDGDGGNNPVIGNLAVNSGTTYTYAVEFLNENENPVEDVTEEVEDEADEHQVFLVTDPANDADFTGGTALSPSITYTDSDSRGCYIGLAGTVSFGATGTGNLRVVLKHQPGDAGKVTVNCTTTPGGNPALGSTDVDVIFPLTVN